MEDNTIYFSRILNPVCSCGNYIGKIQHEIEFQMVLSKEEVKDDALVCKIMNKMNIMRMCCRRTVICSPVFQVIKTSPPFQVHRDNFNYSYTPDDITFGELTL